MTIKQIYLFSAALLCTLACPFGCHASESSERAHYIETWKTELGKNVPALTQPENDTVFTFLCEMRFERRPNIKNIFDQRIAPNTYNFALMKRLPQIVFEALNNHQDQNNRLHRKQIESEDNLNSYDSTLAVFAHCLETLREIDTCIPELFLATDLTAIEQLLKSSERAHYIETWKTELGKNVPVLTQPENDTVFTFLCEMRFERIPKNLKNIFDQKIALNPYNLALTKRLPQIVFEALNNHQDQNNRLHRKQIESEDNLNSHNSTLGIFEHWLETLREIDTCIPELFLAADLTAIEQLLKKFRQTQREYNIWRCKRESARRPISEKISDAIYGALPLPIRIR